MKNIVFNNPPIVTSWYSVVGRKESEGPLGECFDVAEDDDSFGGENWEDAESRMQFLAAKGVIERAGLGENDIDSIVAGDLLGQLIATSFGVKNLNIPVLGVYGACSTIGEAIAIASIMAESPYAKHVIALTSSHYATAEKQFRFPLAYGSQRPQCATTTVTGSGAVMISSADEARESNSRNTERRTDNNNIKEEINNRTISIKSVTIGTIRDYGITDANNMGAAMAPAAYSTIKEHFEGNNVGPDDYDMIVTGDLGEVGSDILIEMFRNDGIGIAKKHVDCGNMIYDRKRQDAHSGGSGCGCSASVLCGYFLPKLMSGELNKILFVPTGALLSTVSAHEGKAIPAIAHGIVFEAGERRE